MRELIIVLYVSVASFYILYLTRGRWFLNPAPLFVVFQTIFFIGTIPLLDMTISADVLHLYVMFVCLCLFILGTLIVDFWTPRSRQKVGIWLSSPFITIESGVLFNLVIWTIVLAAVLISGLYYQAIGYNIFVDQILAFVQGQGRIGDIATLRLATYSGDRYLAPGYVNQFKNILLPILVGYLFARSVLLRRRKDWLASLVLTPVAVVFLLGTGQRGPFVIASLMLIVFFNVVFPAYLVRRLNVVFAAGLFALFALSTVVLGRTVESLSSLSDLSTLFGEIVHRIFSSNQASSVVGFRYVYYDLPIQYGAEWLRELSGILPIKGGGSTLANEIYAILYGTDRGTGPISIWGSIWHNFGGAGIAVVPVVLGVLYQSLYVRLMRGPKTLFRIAIYACLSVLLGFWTIGGPGHLANTGFVTILLLYAVVQVTRHWARRVLGGDGETRRTGTTSGVERRNGPYSGVAG